MIDDAEFEKMKLEEKVNAIHEDMKEVIGRLSELYGFIMGFAATAKFRN